MRARSRILVSGSVLASAIAIAAGAVIGGGPPPAGCNLSATTANFTAQYNALAGGQTLCLASGSYPAFTGGSKPSMVVVKADVGQVVNFAGVDIPTTTRNLTIQGVTYTGQVEVRPPSGTPMNLIFDGVTWGAIDRCVACREGRLTIVDGGTVGVQGSNGVQIKNSTFGPGGCSDGIQESSNGTEIGPNNEFKGIVQSCPGTTAHVDAIQPYGESATNIHDNWIHNNDQGIQSPDGPNNDIIVRNNVIQMNVNPAPCMHAGNMTGATVFDHNVCLQVGQTDADFRIFGGNAAIPSSGVTCRNNIGNCSNESCTSCTLTPNQTSPGVTFVNFAGANSRCSFKLANGSVGKNAATDGTDMGLNNCP